MSLTLVLGAGSTAEAPGAESAAEDPIAKLVRVERVVKVNERVRSVGAALKERDLVSVSKGGLAVIQYRPMRTPGLPPRCGRR